MSLSLVKSFTTVEEAARAVGISLPAFFFSTTHCTRFLFGPRHCSKYEENGKETLF